MTWKDRPLLQRVIPLIRALRERCTRALRYLSRSNVNTPAGLPEEPDVSDEPDVPEEPDYAARIAAETSIFAQQIQVHDLPDIFHYWSNKWLRPQLETFGFSNPDQFFANYLQAAHAEAEKAGRAARFASLGCGNCDTEARVAALLVERGMRDFVIECVDINTDMLARGRALAVEANVADHIVTVLGDFNDWRPQHTYDAVLANQSLHHVMNLEGLFATIESALTEQGRFITSDMIGRNGHMRWPEALAIVHEFWAQLPANYRYNAQLMRHEELYENWDCSKEGFEGIRAQDILPLLVERFDFEFFMGYGNVIDTFVDRGFGPNFNAEADWDRAFIDRVHSRDEQEIDSGTLTPTHMLAVMRRRPFAGKLMNVRHLTPRFCLRRDHAVPDAS